MGAATAAPFRNKLVLSFGAAMFALVFELPAALAILAPELQWDQYGLATMASVLFVLWALLAAVTLLLGWTTMVTFEV